MWTDATAPDSWRIFMTPEALANVHAAPAIDTDRTAALQALVRAALSATPARNTHGGRNAHRAQVDGQDAFARERWRATSSRWLHGYRRVEALFGADTWRGRLRNLRRVYETPNAVANGSAAKTLAHIRTLRGQDLAFIDAVEGSTVRRFAWADGISAYLSDAYRGGMTLNFLLAPMAIVVGIAYLPFATSNEKWLFAAKPLACAARARRS